jgi:hypothetical protein
MQEDVGMQGITDGSRPAFSEPRCGRATFTDTVCGYGEIKTLSRHRDG